MPSSIQFSEVTLEPYRPPTYDRLQCALISHVITSRILVKVGMTWRPILRDSHSPKGKPVYDTLNHGNIRQQKSIETGEERDHRPNAYSFGKWGRSSAEESKVRERGKSNEDRPPNSLSVIDILGDRIHIRQQIPERNKTECRQGK